MRWRHWDYFVQYYTSYLKEARDWRRSVSANPLPVESR